MLSKSVQRTLTFGFIARATATAKFSKLYGSEALVVNRYRAAFQDSVDVRAEIDQAATVINTPLIVGDLVVCRHGTGTLTSCVVGVGVAIRRSSRQNSQIAASLRSRDVEAGTQTANHVLHIDCEGVVLASLWSSDACMHA